MSKRLSEYFQIIRDTLGQRIIKIIQEERDKEIKRGYVDIYSSDLSRLLRRISDKDLNELDIALWEGITDFWDKHLDSVLREVRNDKTLKAFYLRPDIYRPPFVLDILRKTAMYADKIVMVDPIRYGQIVNVKGKLGFARKFWPFDAFYLLLLDEWVDNDLVRLVPQPELWHYETRAKLIELIESDAVKIGEEVKTIDVLGSSEASIKEIPKDKETQEMKIATKEISQRLSSKMNSVLFASEYLGCSPTADWGEDFYYWEWKLKQDAKSLNLDARILFALNKYSINWFGPVPLEVVLDFRKRDMLIDLRASLRDNFGEIRNANDEDFEDTVKLCHENITRELSRAKKDWKNAKKSLLEKVALGTASAIVTGSLSAVASSAMSIPSLYGALVGGGITATAMTINELAGIRSKRRELEQNPVYLLFKAKKGTDKALKIEMPPLIGPSSSMGWTTIIPSDYEDSKLKLEKSYIRKGFEQ